MARRVGRLFLLGADGRRAIWGDDGAARRDPAFRDLLHFHEYFHGDTGKGLGASHQTGWTGLVANLLQESAHGRGVSFPTPATRRSRSRAR